MLAVLLACGTVIHTDALVSGGTTPWANAVLAICVELVLAEAVGAVGVPVNAGEANRFDVLTSTVGFPLTPVAFVMVTFEDPAARLRLSVVFSPLRIKIPFAPGSGNPPPP